MQEVNILDFGADKTGVNVSTREIQAAIDQCPAKGRVLVPEGIYRSGALFLKSNMTLFLAPDAVIKGSDSADDFPIKTYRFEGQERACYASLINAGIGTDGVCGITIEGGGEIDANGVVLFGQEMSEKKGARGRAVCIRNASDICVRDVTIRQSPAWCLHLINCQNVEIDHVKIHTKYDALGRRYEDIYNGDGIDCDSCKNVVITNSLIASQDDCIAIKSGKDAEGRAAAQMSENIHISNCCFESGFGVAVGSEMSGGVRNVTVRDCTFHNTFSIGSIKTCRGRGGVIEDILFENVLLSNEDTEFGDCKWFRGGIYVDCCYSMDERAKEPLPVSEETPFIKNIIFKNAKVDTCGGNAVYISGLPEMHCMGITLENVTAVGKYGMKTYFTDGLKLKNVTVTAREGEDYQFEETTFDSSEMNADEWDALGRIMKKQLAKEIIRRLKEEYPDAACSLDYDQAWKLLVSVRLAAQCTDARVNVVVEKLYEKFPDVNALADAGADEIEKIVRPCGLGRSKARDISACMKILRDEYEGKVPDDFDALLKLPGVGRKSANLIMGDVFKKPAIVTDTHCIRLVNRMGLVDGIKEPAKVEKELWKIIPPEEGSNFCHRLVYHGRDVCTARTKPHCERCCLLNICKKVGVE